MRWKLIRFVCAAALVTTACAQTDVGITTAVKAKLTTDDTVKAYQIDVDTENSVVTLAGSVDTMAAKTRAVELAQDTDGVTRVVDNLTVTPPVAAAPSESPDAARATFGDPGITSTVKTQLLADPTVKGLRIDVDTVDGIVTLTGEVGSQAEKDRALQIARATQGVRDVNDRLTIRPPS